MYGIVLAGRSVCDTLDQGVTNRTRWCVGTTFDTLLLSAAVDTLRALPHVALLLAPANN